MKKNADQTRVMWRDHCCLLMQTPDELQMLAGLRTKRTVFIVTAWLSQRYVQYKMMKLAFKLFIR